MLSNKDLDISEFTIVEEEIEKENKWNETLRLFIHKQRRIFRSFDCNFIYFNWYIWPFHFSC